MMLEKILALFGLATLSAVVAETARADELERALGDTRAAYKRAWGLDLDRLGERRRRREDEHSRVVAFLLGELSEVRGVAS